MSESASHSRGGNGNGGGFTDWLRGVFRGKHRNAALRETIEEIFEEIGEDGEEESEARQRIREDERVMLTNILKMRHLTVYDVMVPRADIVAAEVGTGLDELIDIMVKAGHSRLPVYRNTLDDVIGLVHIKDVVPYVRDRKPLRLSAITRTILFVAPSMRVLDLLLEMRLSRVHMALVVDEFGGIDGLITAEDLLEEIVGEIEDEHDVIDAPRLLKTSDGSLIADARAEIEELEEAVGPVLSEEEREADIDTLGGLVFTIAGRVPARGELIVHPESGISFEVMEADPRRVKRLRVRNLPGTAPLGESRKQA